VVDETCSPFPLAVNCCGRIEATDSAVRSADF